MSKSETRVTVLVEWGDDGPCSDLSSLLSRAAKDLQFLLDHRTSRDMRRNRSITAVVESVPDLSQKVDA